MGSDLSVDPADDHSDRSLEEDEDGLEQLAPVSASIEVTTPEVEGWITLWSSAARACRWAKPIREVQARRKAEATLAWTGVTSPSQRGSSARFLTDVIVDMDLVGRKQSRGCDRGLPQLGYHTREGVDRERCPQP